MRTFISAVFVALMSLGCGPRSVPPNVSGDPSAASLQAGPPVYCQLQGTWTTGTMGAPRAGFEYARVRAAPYRAQLDRAEGVLRLHTVVSAAGWSLGGRVEPEDGELRSASAMWIAEGIGVAGGTGVSVRDARPGEVEVGLSEFAPGEEQGVRFVAEPARWVPCASLSMSFEYRDSDTPRGERVAFGLPSEPPMMSISPEASVSLAHTAGGPSFVQFGPREYPQKLHVLGAQEGFSRVLLHHWTGTLVIGWLPTSALQPEDSGAGGLGVLGGIGERVTEDVCTSPERLMVSVSQEGAPAEPVGVVDAGTRFRRFVSDGNGDVSVAPIRSAPVAVAGQGVRWWVHPEAPLTCVSETYDPATSFRRSLGEPTVELRLTAAIETVEGLRSLSAGDTCAVVLAYRDGERYPCRASVECKDRVLYGALPTNGFFTCELDASDDPTIRGEDTQTSHGSGDPALRIDTGAGTLILEEDAQSSPGPFRLEAQLRPAPEPAPG